MRLIPSLAMFVASCSALAAADVPVKKVMLFSSGVAYIEHGGAVEGDTTAQLRVTSSQLNDLLKSLQVQDLDGGTIGTVAYPTAEPVERTLRSFQLDLSGSPTLGNLLAQARGARVTLAVKGEAVSGTIISVEERPVALGEGQAPRPVVTVLAADGMRQALVDDITRIAFDDARLNEELAKALSAVAQARNQDKRPVEIAFHGTGTRQVRLGYVVEAPVWKVSYRLVLPPPVNSSGKPGALQAWALVDNLTESDWNGVELTLVSGRPVSFVQNLYDPLYLSRPTVQNETFAGLKPRTYDSADKDAEEAKLADVGMPAPASAPMAAMEADGLGMQRAAKSLSRARGGMARNEAINPTASIRSAAQGTNLGEQFVYTVDAVMLPRQRAAMIPIVNGPITVERVSIYNRDQLAAHPMRGAQLTNSTGNHLVAGPVTVLDGGYAGDAQLGSLAPKQTRLVSYAIDLPIRMSVQDNGGQRIAYAVAISKGVMTQTLKYVDNRTYSASSDAADERTVLIEHPRRSGYEVVDTPAPAEKTDDLLRFRLIVPAGKAAALTVKEQHVVIQRYTVADFDRETLLGYAGNGDLPAEVRAVFTKAAQLRSAVADAQNAINANQSELEAASRDQNRVRNNISTVGQSGETGARQLKKLNDLETRIEQLQAKQDGLRTDLETKSKALADFIASIEIK